MNPRFFCPVPLAEGRQMALPEAAAHHVAAVLRLQVGADISVFSGDGGEFCARIMALKPKVVVELLEFDPIEREAPLELTLAHVMPAGDRMDGVVQKAAELGVARLVPLMSRRSVLKLVGERAERRRRHWQLVAAGASEQCGRNRVMAVDVPRPLSHFLGEARDVRATKLVMMPRSGSNLSALAAPHDGLQLLVGPEGGFADDECTAALACGYRALQLGPRVLRADTAGLAAVAAMLTLWGDF